MENPRAVETRGFETLPSNAILPRRHTFQVGGSRHRTWKITEQLKVVKQFAASFRASHFFLADAPSEQVLLDQAEFGVSSVEFAERTTTRAERTEG
jgi:hypothetical protein